MFLSVWCFCLFDCLFWLFVYLYACSLFVIRVTWKAARLEIGGWRRMPDVLNGECSARRARRREKPHWTPRWVRALSSCCSCCCCSCSSRRAPVLFLFAFCLCFFVCVLPFPSSCDAPVLHNSGLKVGIPPCGVSRTNKSFRASSLFLWSAQMHFLL